MISDRTANIIIGVVTAVWAGGIVLGMVNPEYRPDPFVNAIFSLIVGGAFGVRYKAHDKSSNQDQVNKQ